MAEFLIPTCAKAQLMIRCLICGKGVRVFNGRVDAQVCDECKDAVAEAKYFLAEVKKENPWLAERMKKKPED